MQKATLTETIERVAADIEARFGLDSPVLRFAVVRILATIWGGVAYLMARRNDYLEDQIFPASQSEENLVKEAARQNFERNPASYAIGQVQATGTTGITILAGAKLTRSDGESFATLQDATLGASGALIDIRADVAGASGNTAAGVSLEWQAKPEAGLDDLATIPADLSSGADLEELEDFRARFVQFEQADRLNGSPEDYVIWAKQVPGVTRAWSSPNERGLGTIVVRFTRDDDPDRIPDATEIAEVALKLEGERPATAEVIVEAPTFSSVDFSITLRAEDTTANREEIENEIRDLFFRNQAPGDGSEAGGVSLDEVRAAISIVVSKFTLNAPTVDQFPAAGEIIEAGSIDWI